MSDGYILLALLLSSIAVVLTRSLGFIFFINVKSNNCLLKTLERNMPIMIIVVLIFIALRDADFGIAQVVGAFSALAAHWIFKNALITIAFSTAICLLLVAVF